MASAQGGVDAVVEVFEEDVTVLYATWNKVETNEDAAVSAAIDAIPMNEANVRCFHEDGHFAAVLLAMTEGDVVGSCRYSVLTVLCGIADAFSVDDDSAIASNFAYTAAMKINFEHNCICFS
ncbi:MAG: hypothetical protein IKX93_08670 [Bacteroidaceae bacterium]|nr:hypothetical protein [Bacteroidaceae bacterium]